MTTRPRNGLTLEAHAKIAGTVAAVATVIALLLVPLMDARAAVVSDRKIEEHETRIERRLRDMGADIREIRLLLQERK